MFLVWLLFEGQDLCSAKRCTGKGQICVVNNHNQAVCQCRESCPRPGHQERVCGSDGLTYPSRCILDMTSCKLGTDITVDSNRCKGMTVSQEKITDSHFLDILGYFEEYPQKSQIWRSETSPNQWTLLGIPWLGLVSLCQIWDFYGYSLNTLNYPKMDIIFSCLTYLGSPTSM